MAKLSIATRHRLRFTDETRGMRWKLISWAQPWKRVFVLFDSTPRTRQRQRQRNKQRVNDNPVNVDGHPNQEEVTFYCFFLVLSTFFFFCARLIKISCNNWHNPWSICVVLSSWRPVDSVELLDASRASLYHVICFLIFPFFSSYFLFMLPLIDLIKKLQIEINLNSHALLFPKTSKNNQLLMLCKQLTIFCAFRATVVVV